MLIRRKLAVILPDQFVEGNDRIDIGTWTDQMNSAAVAKAEVATIGGHKLVLKGGCSMPYDSGLLSGCDYVLSYFTLLVESAVSSLLVVAGHSGGVGDIHQLARAFVGKWEGLYDLNLAGVVLGLGPRPGRERRGYDRSYRCNDSHDTNYFGFHRFLLVRLLFSSKAVLECCFETRGIIGDAPSKSLQPGAQLFLNRFSTG